MSLDISTDLDIFPSSSCSVGEHDDWQSGSSHAVELEEGVLAYLYLSGAIIPDELEKHADHKTIGHVRSSCFNMQESV